MTVWKRLFALASTTSVVAAAVAYVGGSGAAAQTSGVSFTSQPTVANLVAHYVVSPTGTTKHAASASTDENRLAALWPQGNVPASLVGNAGGGSRNNSGSGTVAAATPLTTSGFIGPQASANTLSYFCPGCNPPHKGLAGPPPV